MWKLNETVPNNHGVNENKLQWKLKNILDELKQNTTNQNSEYATKVLLRNLSM